MTVDRLLDQVEDMSDLELAVLLSLITKEHCVIEADEISLDDLARELRIITADGFGLSSVTIDCSDTVNLTDFAESILVDAVSDSSRTSSTDGGSSPGEYAPRSTVDHVQFGSKRLSSGQAHRGLDIRKVANVVFLQNLDLAPEAVQVQGLELIRRRRIFGRTAVHTVPDIFLFMPLVSSSRKVNRLSRLNKHLNDHIMMHHLHNGEDGFPYLERTRASSSVHTPSLRSSTAHTMSSSSTIKRLQTLADSVFVAPEVRRYIAGIPVFLRLQAAVFTGISPRATSHLILLSKALAVIHRLTYVTPSLVDLATQKIYPHRISIAAPQQERSLQYGSALEAIKSTLKDATPQTIIFKTLDNLEQPP